MVSPTLATQIEKRQNDRVGLQLGACLAHCGMGREDSGCVWMRKQVGGGLCTGRAKRPLTSLLSITGRHGATFFDCAASVSQRVVQPRWRNDDCSATAHYYRARAPCHRRFRMHALRAQCDRAKIQRKTTVVQLLYVKM